MDWTLFARGESIESKELLGGGQIRGAGEISLGAIRDFRLAEHWKIGLGGLYAFDFAPSSPTASYGSAPHGTMAFVRWSRSEFRQFCRLAPTSKRAS